MDYVPIRVSTLRGDQSVNFDAYVKINDKFVLYVRKGDSFEGDRLVRLKSKKLKKMYIAPEQDVLYRSYLEQNMELAYSPTSPKSIETKAEIAQGHLQSASEEVFENADSEEVYTSAKKNMSKFVNFLTSQKGAIYSVLNIDNVDQNLAHHGVAVSTLAVALADKLNIREEKQILLLALGSLLHDFGHVGSEAAFNKPMSSMTKEELMDYKQHPARGALLVQDKQHFDRTVINIITQHEEYIDGGGFPNKLREKDIDPLALICGCCNAVDRLITFEGVARKDAVKQYMITSVGRYPLEHMKLLAEVLSSFKNS